MKRDFLSKFKTLAALTAYFKNNQKCRDFLAEQRWQGVPVCPYCGSKEVFGRKDGRYGCRCCRKAFSVLVGTVFQNTKLPLIKWFVAIYLICNSKQGISSCQLSNEIDVTQKTAWFMLQKIRLLLRDKDDGFLDRVSGDLVDLSDDPSSPLIVRRRLSPLQLHPVVLKYVTPGSRIFSDDYICYQSLSESEKEKYHTEDPHGMCRDSNGKSVVQQGVADGLWLQLKRMVMGIYHFVSSSLFHRYVYEALFRRTKCRAPNGLRFLQVMSRTGEVIPYKVVRPK